MEAILGSLQSLGLYTGMVALGIFVGSRKKLREAGCAWLGPVQTVVLILLILSLGIEIGADQEVVSSLGTIGLSALTITALALVGSVGAVFAVRKLLKLDREGKRGEGGEEE